MRRFPARYFGAVMPFFLREIQCRGDKHPMVRILPQISLTTLRGLTIDKAGHLMRMGFEEGHYE
ncbi:hypothetical protein [Silicibacter sp. TrichCH4B]|uniref:hypothetical protein n=1 Tax=Tritonibacter mobilis TaxID=379347 RepID=UPI0012660E82